MLLTALPMMLLAIMWLEPAVYYGKRVVALCADIEHRQLMDRLFLEDCS
jgi:hypothetical protein